MEFFKLSGAGNDFIAFDDRGGHLPGEASRPEWFRRLCARAEGVGADGVLVLETSPDADVGMRYHNADGGEAEMCGNGLRCLVRLAHHLGAAAETMTVRTAAGLHRGEVLGPERVRVSITDPEDARDGVILALDDEVFEAVQVHPGVPHVAIELHPNGALDGFDVAGVGSRLRRHPKVMPQGANVNFYAREAPGRLRMRTYERGVEAETLACGTGAVSCAVAAMLRGDEPPFEVITHGGDVLSVHLRREGDLFTDTLLEGPAVITYTGTLGTPLLP